MHVDLLVRLPLGEVEAALLDGLHELAHALLLQVLFPHLQEDLGDASLLGGIRKSMNTYRMTHQVVPKVELTSKQKLSLVYAPYTKAQLLV